MLTPINTTWPGVKAVRISQEANLLYDDPASSEISSTPTTTLSIDVATQTTTTTTTEGTVTLDNSDPTGASAQGGSPAVGLSSLINPGDETDSADLASSTSEVSDTDTQVIPTSSGTLSIEGGITVSSFASTITSTVVRTATVSATLSSAVTPVTSVSAPIYPVYAPSYSLTHPASSDPSSATVPVTQNEAHHSSTSIIAGVVPTAFILIGVILCLWWRHRRGKKTTRKNGQKDLEDEAFAENKVTRNVERSASKSSEGGGPSSHSLQARLDPIPVMRNYSRTGTKSRPSDIAIPQIDSTTSLNGGRNNSINISATQLDDPFLTPTSQDTFPSPTLLSSGLFGNLNFRPSQIGLAVTTPPAAEISAFSSSSTSSLGSEEDSTSTVIHHAETKTFSRIVPTLSTVRMSSDHSSSTHSDAQLPRPNNANVNKTTANPTIIAPNQTNKSSPTDSTNSIPKSETPPQDFAMLCIEALRAEAAQATEAAANAARQAKELKRKDVAEEC